MGAALLDWARAILAYLASGMRILGAAYSVDSNDPDRNN
jgi:hypothetical protein